MVSFLFGERAYAVGKSQCVGKVREAINSLDPSDSIPFNDCPIRDLRFEFLDLGLGHEW